MIVLMNILVEETKKSKFCIADFNLINNSIVTVQSPMISGSGRSSPVTFAGKGELKGVSQY
jgi:hypothetical protein